MDDADTDRILTLLLELGINTFVCLQAEVNIHIPDHAWRAGMGLRPYIKDAQRLLSRAHEANSSRIKQRKIDFLHLPIIDGSVTTDMAMSRLADDCCERVLRGEKMYIHCWCALPPAAACRTELAACMACTQQLTHGPSRSHMWYLLLTAQYSIQQQLLFVWYCLICPVQQLLPPGPALMLPCVTCVHCRGGHGRTGTLVATMLGRLYGLPYSTALRYTQGYHDTRVYPQGVRSPQTAVQRAQVG
jgi:hypothetical protein